LAIIVGIGINVTSKSFPPELVETASSLENELDKVVTFPDLESILLRLFDKWYKRLCDGGSMAIVEEWSKRSSYASGKSVGVTLTGESIVGITNGLESDGALRVVGADGSSHVVHAGDIERLRPSEQFD